MAGREIGRSEGYKVVAEPTAQVVTFKVENVWT